MPAAEPHLSHHSPPHFAPGVSHVPALPPAPGDELQDFTKYLLALRRRWLLLVVCAVLAVGFALVRYSLTTKEYSATATIQIERKRLALYALGQAGWLEDWWNMEYYPTQYRLLRSRGMAERVVQNLRLFEDPSFAGRSADLLPAGGDGPVSAAEDRAAIAELAGKLQAGLGVNPIKETQLVELTFLSHSPELAARIANGYAQAFIEWGIETRVETVRGASSFLIGQIESLREEIETQQRELNAYTHDSDIIVDPAGEKLLERQGTLEEKYNQVVLERISEEARYRELVEQPDEAIAATHGGTEVRQLRDALAKLESEYEQKLATYTPDWPGMQDLRAQIDDAGDRLERLVRDKAREVRIDAQTNYDQARRQQEVLEAELRDLAGEARTLNSTALEYQNRLTNLETRRNLLTELLKRQSETEVASRIETPQESNVRVVDEAVVPARPSKPSLKSGLTQAVSLGFLGGIGLILLIEFLDRTVKKPEELEAIMGLPTLAVIPDIDERRPGGLRMRYGGYGGYGGYGYGGYGYGGYGGEARPRPPGARLLERLRRRAEPPPAESDGEERDIELLPHTNPRLAVCEAYRSLRTALLLSTAHELKVVALTSAEPGEGKTATSTNLGVVLAQLGRRVLVIDGDLRRPRMHKVFRVSNRFGLVSCLTQNVDLDRTVHKTEVPNLFVCPAGPVPPNPSELLASDRMREILQGARERFDFVVVDTPPSLPVADAIILGTLADGVVVCARAGMLLREDARACRERLRYAELRILGTVLNRYRTSPNRYNRRYQYYGGYGDAPAQVPADSAA